MRDVILARVGARREDSRNPQSGNFAHLLVEKVAGVDVTINRGWTAVDATVRGSKPFRFVDTHLESFDNRRSLPEHPRPAGGRAGRRRAARRPASCR